MEAGGSVFVSVGLVGSTGAGEGSDESEEADATDEVVGESGGSSSCALSHLARVAGRSGPRTRRLGFVPPLETEPQYSGAPALISL